MQLWDIRLKGDYKTRVKIQILLSILKHIPSPTVLLALPHRTNTKPSQPLGSLPSNQPCLNMFS